MGNTRISGTRNSYRLQEALVREIKEEAGVDCHHGRLIAVEQNELTYFRITSLFEVAGDPFFNSFFGLFFLTFLS